MQNVHGKEIDLLRVTVKVPGKRPPRAVTPAGPCTGPALVPASGVNGVPKGGPSSSTEGPTSSLSGEQNLYELVCARSGSVSRAPVKVRCPPLSLRRGLISVYPCP